MKKLFITLTLLTALAACNENTSARNSGGTATKRLPSGRKLVNVTWKDDSLWILTREMRPGETAETYKFSEDSAFGILQGTVVIVESR
jgi:hypothetical protein